MGNNDIRGTVTDAQGDPIQGATVSLFLADEASAVRETTTDSNGEYIFDLHPDGTGSSEDWHVAVSYTDANGTQNALSKPFVSASLPDFTFPVAASNLVAWYPFDPSEGARDQTGGVAGVGDPKDYSGTVNGATYQASGGVIDINSGSGSGAYEFDGSNDFINLPNATVDGLSEISMLCWANIQQSPTGFDGIFHNKSFQDIGIMAEDNDTYHVEMTTDTGNNISPSGGSIQQNVWEHLVLTWSGVTNEFNFYVNGNLRVNSSLSGNTVDSPNFSGTTLGKRTDTEDYFGGLIDDVRIYNRALTESEINQIFQNTAPKVNDATGGSTVTTETIDGQEYKIHAFENTGTSTFTVNDADPGATVDVLVVGGGGGGGSSYHSGGGGAGGLVFKSNKNVTQQNYSIIVGSGGDFGQFNGDDGEPGEDSSAFGLTAIGGGKGGGNEEGTSIANGGNGGSGGGGAASFGNGGSALQPSSTDGGFGKDGGDAGPNNSDDSGAVGGGGGGASELGTTANNFNDPAPGGDGLDYSGDFGTTFGENGFFAGGGAGGNQYISDGGAGGLGGGGDGGDVNGSAGAGTPNTGGGGGGGGDNNSGAKGGSGIVLIRYRI